jgi:hypothetical protein
MNLEDLMEGGEPQPVKSTDRVALTGETIDSDVVDMPVNIIEEIPAKNEEPERVIQKTAVTPEMSPVEKRFLELGLDKQFKGGLSEAIERIPDMNRYINDLTHERKALKELREQQVTPQAKPAEAPSADDFYNDPINVLSKVVDSRLESVNRQFEEMRAESFINSKSDFHAMEPLMEGLLQQNPGLKQLGVQALPILYQMAKGSQLSQVAAEASRKATPSPRKSSAETGVGARVTKPDINDLSYWRGKTRKEMEEEIGFAPEP